MGKLRNTTGPCQQLPANPCAEAAPLQDGPGWPKDGSKGSPSGPRRPEEDPRAALSKQTTCLKL
eukprot:5209393-Pyramimonas_sp.AAC.1